MQSRKNELCSCVSHVSGMLCLLTAVSLLLSDDGLRHRVLAGSPSEVNTAEQMAGTNNKFTWQVSSPFDRFAVRKELLLLTIYALSP